MRLIFDWDPRKARSNLLKHGVSFDDAMDVFRDQLALTIYDDDSDDEDRWITIGRAAGMKLLLVVHTHVEIANDIISVRIIPARRPTRTESARYRRGG